MTDYKPQGSGVATPRRHEGADLSARKIAITAILLILFLAATHFALKGVIDAFASVRRADAGISGTTPHAFGSQIPPEPRLQSSPKTELDELNAKQKSLLSSYGWTDDAHTKAHIPIADAEVLLIQRGLPAVGAQVAPSPAPLPEERRINVR